MFYGKSDSYWLYQSDQTPGYNYICALEQTLVNFNIIEDFIFYMDDVLLLDSKYGRNRDDR